MPKNNDNRFTKYILINYGLQISRDFNFPQTSARMHTGLFQRVFREHVAVISVWVNPFKKVHCPVFASSASSRFLRLRFDRCSLG